MSDSTLERLPMTMGYFRLILRRFGDTPERRDAILAGTGLSEAALVDPTAGINLLQQVRQFDNLNALLGEGWVFSAPDLWGHASHGALALAALTSPDLDTALTVAARYSHARAPYYRVNLRREREKLTLEYRFGVALELVQWRTIVEMAFMGLPSVIAAILGERPDDMRFLFACPEPAYSGRARQVLGAKVVYEAPVTALELPTRHLKTPSPFADATLHARAIEELEQAVRRQDNPLDVRGRVETLLSGAAPAQMNSAFAALALGMSHRTLVRRLADAGAGFRELADTEKKRRAMLLIEAGAMTHAEIAEQLGYADATSFSRSLRRWFNSNS